MSNFLSVERTLRTAAPHALLDAVRSALAAHYGAHAVDLLMADYSQRVLQPVTALPHTRRRGLGALQRPGPGVRKPGTAGRAPSGG